MGTCIICGKSTDGLVCSLHEEDVVYEFRGDRADQLVPGRYYRGSVDGFADFGVFVDIGDSVTGLLHKSEIDGRLENLSWDPGDTVYVQVTDVHSNGNVDLGWSIRQSGAEFRGRLVHDPDADDPVTRADPVEREEPVRTGPTSGRPATPADDVDEAEETDETVETDATETDATETDAAETDAAETDETDETEDATGPAGEPIALDVADLDDHVGDRVRIEGRIVDAYQTGGPTIFVVADGTDRVDCAAFESAGVRAYPEIEEGAIVGIVGEAERRQGDLQVETESIEVLTDEARTAVEERLDTALDQEARPPETDLLVDDDAVAARQETIVEVATAIRRAIVEGRPVVIRHTATVDGYVAGAAIERAVLPLVRENHASGDAEYHYIDRRPLEEPFYDMGSATKDVTRMLESADRHSEKHPLFVFADAGRTPESLDGLDLLGVYDVSRIVVDTGDAADDVADVVETFLGAPADENITSAVIAANVAAHVNPDVRDDLPHLPAVSYWENAPEAYVDLAAEHGYDDETVARLREAIALEAFYQSYEDKREIVQDLFWEGDNRSFAEYISTQFRTKLDGELDTVRPHVENREAGPARVSVLDADAFTHRFDFPPTSMLLDALHRRLREEVDGPQVTIAIDSDALSVRSTDSLAIPEISAAVADRLPEAGVRAAGAVAGRIEFLVGEREAVLDATIDEIGTRLDADERTSEATARED